MSYSIHDPYPDDDAAAICPRTVSSASQLHIQNVITKLQATIAHKQARSQKLAELVLSLNPKCNEIGAGMLAQLQSLAREIQQ